MVVITTDNPDLWAARRARARRWLQAGQDLRGYRALDADAEIDATLVAVPPEQIEKKPTGQMSEQAS